MREAVCTAHGKRSLVVHEGGHVHSTWETLSRGPRGSHALTVLTLPARALTVLTLPVRALTVHALPARALTV